MFVKVEISYQIARGFDFADYIQKLYQNMMQMQVLEVVINLYILDQIQTDVT